MIDAANKQIEIKEEIEALTSLFKLDEFQSWAKTMEEQVGHRRAMYETKVPEKGMDDLIVNEFTRGEIAGLHLAIHIFSAKLQAAQEALKTFEVEKGETNAG